MSGERTAAWGGGASLVLAAAADRILKSAPGVGSIEHWTCLPARTRWPSRRRCCSPLAGVTSRRPRSSTRHRTTSPTYWVSRHSTTFSLVVYRTHPLMPTASFRDLSAFPTEILRHLYFFSFAQIFNGFLKQRNVALGKTRCEWINHVADQFILQTGRILDDFQRFFKLQISNVKQNRNRTPVVTFPHFWRTYYFNKKINESYCRKSK